MDQATTNYVWFLESLPTMLAGHRGQHVLLHKSSAVGYYPTSMDGIKAGLAQFGEGNFSVEAVDDSVEDLGFFSHVSTTMHA